MSTSENETVQEQNPLPKILAHELGQWLEHLRAEDRALSTLRDYETDVRSFVRWSLTTGGGTSSIHGHYRRRCPRLPELSRKFHPRPRNEKSASGSIDCQSETGHPGRVGRLSQCRPRSKSFSQCEESGLRTWCPKGSFPF